MSLAHVIPRTEPLATTNFLERDTGEDLQLYADPFVAAPIEPTSSRDQRDNAHTDMSIPAAPGANGPQPGEKGFVPDVKRRVRTSHIVDSTLVKTPLPGHTGRSPSGSLWSYSSPLPALKINGAETPDAPAGSTTPEVGQRGRKSQFKAPLSSPENGKQRPPDSYPSSSLWAYGEKKRAKGF